MSSINSNTPSETMRENPFVLQAGSKHACQERRGSRTGPGNVPGTVNDLIDSTGGRSQLQLMLGVLADLMLTVKQKSNA